MLTNTIQDHLRQSEDKHKTKKIDNEDIGTYRAQKQKGKLRLAEEENLLLSIIFSCHEMSWKSENRNFFDRLNKVHRDMKV